jgi:hypothetical protein
VLVKLTAPGSDGWAVRMRSWWAAAGLPLTTTGFFLAFAAVFWANAIVNRYRFNVAVAVVGTIPLAALLVRGAIRARSQERDRVAPAR